MADTEDNSNGVPIEGVPAQEIDEAAGVRGGRGGRANGTRVYVGNLSYTSSWQDLKDHMRAAGEVVYADVFRTETGYSKGCGVVEYATEGEAQKAINSLNDTILEGTDRQIFVREDRIDFDPFRGRGRGAPRGAPRGAYMPRGGARGYGMGRAGVMMPPPVRGGGFRGAPLRGVPQYAAPRGMRGAPMPYRGGGGRGRYPGPLVEGSRANRQIFVGNLPYQTSWQDLKDIFGEIGTILRADILFGPDGRSKGMGTVCFETEEAAQKAIEKMNEYEHEGRTIHVSKDKYAK